MRLVELIPEIGRPVVYYPALNNIIGDTESNIFFCYIVFWSSHTDDDANGWVYKTADEIHKETGLNKHTQQAVRKRLAHKGLLEEKRKGLPARMYFRANTHVLIQLWDGANKPINDKYQIAINIIETYYTSLKQMSVKAKERAESLGVIAKYVDYVELLEKYGSWCNNCNSVIENGPGQQREDLRFVHEIPLAKGGSHTSENIRPRHVFCVPS